MKHWLHETLSLKRRQWSIKNGWLGKSSWSSHAALCLMDQGHNIRRGTVICFDRICLHYELPPLVQGAPHCKHFLSTLGFWEFFQKIQFFLRKCLNVHSLRTNSCLNVHGVCKNLCLNVHSPYLLCILFEYGKGMSHVLEPLQFIWWIEAK